MPLSRVIILAIVQGLTELLPVSSSAHVVVAEKLMGIDPSAPEMTLLLVMLHTGTMFAVIVYFWKQWQMAFFSSTAVLRRFALLLALATAATGILGELLVKVIERLWFHDPQHAEVELLFSHLELVAPALAAVGALIVISGLFEKRSSSSATSDVSGLDVKNAVLIGAVQGLCLPFRGFSRSGATISTGLLAGVAKKHAEQFSFALAVILTPPVVGREVWRLVKAEHIIGVREFASTAMPSVVGAFCAFMAGLLALRWLSRWLEGGRWHLFGIYCLIAAGAVAILHHVGY